MLKARVFTALALLALFLFALFVLPTWGWTAFVAVAIGIAAWEWGGLGGFARSGRIAYALASAVSTGGGGMLLLDSFAVAPLGGIALPLYALAAVFWLVMVPLWMARKWRLRPAALAVVVGWLVLLPAAVALLQLRAFDPLAVLAAMATIWAADIAAYFAGRAYGRRKLAPQISPGKTWEGVAGAVLAVIVYGYAVLAAAGVLAGQGGPGHLALLAGLVLLTALSIIGDLFESLLKRQAGLKDSGQILPGHGGLLDRIDSLTSTLPLVCIALVMLNR
jgi:phosphatidate cytidylyltransferase